jgi:hypothetical protein
MQGCTDAPNMYTQKNASYGVDIDQVSGEPGYAPTHCRTHAQERLQELDEINAGACDGLSYAEVERTMPSEGGWFQVCMCVCVSGVS